MEKDFYMELRETLDKVNGWEKQYFVVKGKLLESETKLALKKSELIKANKITGRNDMFREAQLIQWAGQEYQEVRKLQKELMEIQSRYYPLKREWDFLTLLVNSRT